MGGSESLEQARAIGDTFTGGDVFWDAGRGAIYGKASGAANQDFLHIFSDKVGHAQVIDSNKDGAGTIRPISIQIAGSEVLGITASGVKVTGKLTVTGAMDPTSVSLSGTAEGAQVLYFDSADGMSTPLSAAGHARMRYNDTTKAWEQSINGGAYIGFGGAGSDTTAWHNTGDGFGADGILGLTSNHAVKLFANNIEYGRIVDTGANVNWTGPRLLVGTTAAFFPNADIISIKKNLGDQLAVTMQNTNSNMATPAGSVFVLIDDTGVKQGGINILNTNWPVGLDGVNPGEYACIAFGGPAVYGTQTAQNVRFIANKLQWAHYDLAAVNFQLDNSNLLVHDGIISAINPGATLQIGDAGAPGSAGGIKAGVSGHHSFLFENNVGDQAVYGRFTGDGSRFTVVQAISGAASGSAFSAYFQAKNTDGKSGYFVIPETGVANSFFAKASSLTISAEAGYSVRCNSNGTNNSGWVVDTSSNFFSNDCLPLGGNGVGSVGATGQRWGKLWTVDIDASGGILVGTATGGNQGAGTINVATDIFKNGLAYTNPKWVLQHHYTGNADVEGLYAAPKEYGGLMSLDAHEEIVRAKHDLPLMLLKPKGGYMARGDLLLASVEEAYLYIYQLHRRVKELESRLLIAA